MGGKGAETLQNRPHLVLNIHHDVLREFPLDVKGSELPRNGAWRKDGCFKSTREVAHTEWICGLELFQKRMVGGQGKQSYLSQT